MEIIIQNNNNRCLIQFDVIEYNWTYRQHDSTDKSPFHKRYSLHVLAFLICLRLYVIVCLTEQKEGGHVCSLLSFSHQTQLLPLWEL